MIDATTILNLLSRYKEKFAAIHNKEIYKWEAVSQFQRHWNPIAQDFKTMLLNALDNTGELMDSGQYFPKRMLTHYLNLTPKTVQALFSVLYNESVPLWDRMIAFTEGMNKLRDEFTPGKNHYQDPRAIMVYLNMRYPDQYFLYKFKMFIRFAEKVSYPYQINQREKFENVLLFQSRCCIVRQFVIADPQLIKLHHSRLTDIHHPDTGYHLLTQDIIYAASEWQDELQTTKSTFTVDLITEQQITPKSQDLQLKAHRIEFFERAVAQKWIGDLGEQAVPVYEHEKLRRQIYWIKCLN